MANSVNPQPLLDPEVLGPDDLLDLDDVDRYKKYDCQRYERCLSIAAQSGWPQFHCNSCDAYVPLPDDHHARRLFARAGALLFQRAREATDEREPSPPIPKKRPASAARPQVAERSAHDRPREEIEHVDAGYVYVAGARRRR